MPASLMAVARIPLVDLHIQHQGAAAAVQQGLARLLDTTASRDFPVAEQASNEILSLPLFPEITAAPQEQVVAVLANALRHK